MNKKPISVVLVDDHPVVMEGLRSLFKKNVNIEIAGSFTTGKEALDFLKRKLVDVVLLDISLPDMNGVDLCFKIKIKAPGTCILALTNFNERSIILRMLQNGASGYLLKNSSSQELMKSILRAVEGNLVLNKEVRDILAQGRSLNKTLPKLTRREKEVLKLVAEGMTTVSIAEKLFISPLTVETHRRNLMQKLEVNNSAALIKVAIEQGII